MTNEQLIKKAQEVMVELWHFNGGALLDHEQSAYICLMLLSERLEKIQKVQAIIEKAYKHAIINIEAGQPVDEASFGYEEGVLITNLEAADIYHAIFGTVKNM